MNLFRVRKSGLLSRHRHPQPVHGLVLKGRSPISNMGLAPLATAALLAFEWLQR